MKTRASALTAFLTLLLLLSLTGCSASIQEYQQEAPALNLDQFFQGKLEAYGMVQNFRGKVTRRFKAEIVGNWQGNVGILDERFEYDDGEIDYRCWRLEKSGNQYKGTAGDVIGEAQGETQGNALNWQYVLQVSVDGKPMNINLDDWLYLIDDNHLINRTTMSYWGIPVGEVTLHIEKLNQREAASLSEGCVL